MVTWIGYHVIRAESPLAIDGVCAFELLWEYEVGALVGLRDAIIGTGNVELGPNTDVMQQDADFITADFLYMFRASSAHHQEYKILTRQPSVQVVMVAGGSSLRHIRDETKFRP